MARGKAEPKQRFAARGVMGHCCFKRTPHSMTHTQGAFFRDSFPDTAVRWALRFFGISFPYRLFIILAALHRWQLF